MFYICSIITAWITFLKNKFMKTKKIPYQHFYLVPRYYHGYWLTTVFVYLYPLSYPWFPAPVSPFNDSKLNLACYFWLGRNKQKNASWIEQFYLSIFSGVLNFMLVFWYMVFKKCMLNHNMVLVTNEMHEFYLDFEAP